MKSEKERKIEEMKKEMEKSKIPQPPPPPQQQQNPIQQLAFAINNMANRVSNIEIEIHRLQGDVIIEEKERDLLNKQLNFAFKKIDELEK